MKPASVGEVEAVLDFCLEVNPDFTRYYGATRRAILGNVAEHARGAIRRSRSFKAAYAASRKSIDEIMQSAGLHTNVAAIAFRKAL